MFQNVQIFSSSVALPAIFIFRAELSLFPLANILQLRVKQCMLWAGLWYGAAESGYAEGSQVLGDMSEIIECI